MHKKLVAAIVFLAIACAGAVAQESDKVYEVSELNEGSTSGPHRLLKEKFVEGNPLWMTPILLCLIAGLSLSIERIIVLNLSDTHSGRLRQKTQELLPDMEAFKQYLTQHKSSAHAMLLAAITAGQGRGSDALEKKLSLYGSVEAAKLERGINWLSLLITVAPMLGFLGTVVGMIEAFDAIEQAGDLNPSVVAGGIKVALLTTVAGLITALILQFFYNYCTGKIDKIVSGMEETGLKLIEKYDNHA